MSKVENAVSYAEKIARDDKHGYDQIDRWGNPNFDCSGLVITALEKSGIYVKSNGGTYTGNMPEACEAAGMKNVRNSVNLSNCSGLLRGDVLLNQTNHTLFYCGNKKVVGARINENGKTVGGKSGDQTGNEISIHNYYNYPWTHVYRYTESTVMKSNEVIADEIIAGKWGNGEERKNKLTSCGYSYDKIQKIVNDKLAGEYVSNKTLETVANEVIAGKWGNYPERKTRLEAVGMNYSQVQTVVNELLKNK